MNGACSYIAGCRVAPELANICSRKRIYWYHSHGLATVGTANVFMNMTCQIHESNWIIARVDAESLWRDWKPKISTCINGRRSRFLY